MNTYKEFEYHILEGNNLHSILETNTNVDWFKTAQTYLTFALQVLGILAKYFFKNGKLYAPSLIMFWKYFGLVTELYTLFKTFSALKKND